MSENAELEFFETSARTGEGVSEVSNGNDIYPGSSTHSKVVFREVLHQIELEFKSQF